jgi:hypothetical protein
VPSAYFDNLHPDDDVSRMLINHSGGYDEEIPGNDRQKLAFNLSHFIFVDLAWIGGDFSNFHG